MALPEPLITARQLALGSVSFQTKLGLSVSGKAQERRIRVVFATANVPTPFFHGLGKKPTGFTPMLSNKNGAVGGTIYSDMPLICDTRTLILKCTLAGTEAEVIVR